MSNSKEKIAETLRRAIKGEEEGYYFYDLVSKKVTHPDAKIKLTFTFATNSTLSNTKQS